VTIFWLFRIEGLSSVLCSQIHCQQALQQWDLDGFGLLVPGFQLRLERSSQRMLLLLLLMMMMLLLRLRPSDSLSGQDAMSVDSTFDRSA
jgi:hypothetical protein